MPPLVQAQKDFLLVGREASWGSGPGAADALGVRARPWSLRNMPTRAIPQGERTGTRDLDTQSSVPGRRHTEGDVPMFWRADTGGLFMLAALGAEAVSAGAVGAAIYKKHHITCADVPPSLYFDSFNGAVEPGTSTQKAYRYTGARLNTWNMTWNADDDTGLLDFTFGFIGKFGARITKPTITSQFSGLNVVPSWSAVVNRGGIATPDARELSLTFENNNVRVKTGVGSQDDQDLIPGGRRVSGTITYLYRDETEYDMFLNAADEDLEIIFTGTNLIETVSATPQYDKLRIHIPKATYVDYGKEEIEGNFYVQRIGFRGFHDDSIGGPLEVDVYNASAAYAA